MESAEPNKTHAVSSPSSIPVTDPAYLADLEYRRALIARAKTGDARAFNEYFKLNEGLFKKTVGRYSKWLDEDQRNDLWQEGMSGLLDGITRYDTQRATDRKPEGYVFQWVRARVGNYAKKHGVQASRRFVSENFKVGQDDEDEISLFDCIKDDSADTQAELIDREVHLVLNEAVSGLLPKEKIIARRRLFSDEPDTLEDIGEDLGVSRERIRQIETEVREKLRKRLLPRIRELAIELHTPAGALT